MIVFQRHRYWVRGDEVDLQIDTEVTGYSTYDIDPHLNGISILCAGNHDLLEGPQWLPERVDL